MRQIIMNPGAVARGDFGQGLLLGGNAYKVSDALADDLVNRGLAVRDNRGGAESVVAQLPIPVGGFRVGVIGASTVARNFVEYKVSVGNYQRFNKQVTAVVNKAGQASLGWLPGRAIRFAAQNNPEVEGQFDITSYADQDATYAVVTWYDDRADTSTIADNGELHDLHSYSNSGAWVQMMNIALGGKCEFVIVGTGSTNLADWDAGRLSDQLLKYGPFDAILVDGLIGNTFLGIANGTPGKTLTFDQVKAQMAWLIEFLTPYCRVLLVPTAPANRNVPPSSSAYTTGAMIMRWLYSEAISKYRNLIVVPQGEVLASNWQDPASPLISDVMGGYPPVLWMFSDGTHHSWPSMVRAGAVHAFSLQKALGYFLPELGSMAASRAENSVPELGGRYNPVVGSGRWGQRAIKGSADAGSSGSQPTNTAWSVTNTPTGSSVVHSVNPNAEGGYDWSTLIIDPNGHAQGSIYKWEESFVGAGSLLALFNDPNNAGRRLRAAVPLGINWTTEFAALNVELGVFGTSGGVEYQLGAFLSSNGLYSLGGTSKGQVAYGSVAAGGSGYAPGDKLTVVGGTSSTVAKLMVTAVDGSGAVTRFMVYQGGTYTVTPGNAVSVTGGSGSGATFNLTWSDSFRAADWGVSGTFTLPREVTVPRGMTWTSVVQRLTVGGVPARGFGTLAVRHGAGALYEVVG